MIKYYKSSDNIVTLTMDMDGRSVNIINHEIGRAFMPVLQHLKKEKAAGKLRGVIITSAKKSFLAGGDLDYLYQVKDAQEVFDFVTKLKHLFRELETPGIPVVAALNGSALGGGYELALACNYRICVDEPETKIGLPEVSLGLLPGGGGCIRLMWLLGLEKAFGLLTEGRQLSPKEALAQGLIDEVATSQEDMMERARAWLHTTPFGIQAWDKPNAKIPGGTPQTPKIAQLIAGATAILVQKTRNNYPAVNFITSILAEGAVVDFDTAMRIESRYFTQLVMSQTSKNMTKAFWFDLNKIKDGESRPRGYGKFRPRKIGVIGSGMMGQGIAYTAALNGLEVVLKDVSLTIAQKGKQNAVALLQKRVSRGKLTQEEATKFAANIHATEKFEDFKHCDLVIEAVFENREVKATVTRETEKYLDRDALFASNTSTLPITSLAQKSVRPGNFIGLHFFSPVDKMPLVEIIRGEKTTDETLARAFDFVKLIKKTPIVVNDSRGFYTSRVFSTYILEGIAMLLEGQSPSAIEQAGLNAGMPVGALALTDEVSLALALSIEQQTAKDLGENYRAHPAVAVLQKMVVELNRHGKAKGAGFYDYPTDGKKHLWAGLKEHFPQQTLLPNVLLQERLMFVQALETVRCVEEKVLVNIADANIGSIFGWGFAPFKGGTLQFINDFGVAAFAERCQVLEQTYGDRFKVPALLMEMATNGKEF